MYKISCIKIQAIVVAQAWVCCLICIHDARGHAVDILGNTQMLVLLQLHFWHSKILSNPSSYSSSPSLSMVVLNSRDWPWKLWLPKTPTTYHQLTASLIASILKVISIHTNLSCSNKDFCSVSLWLLSFSISDKCYLEKRLFGNCSTYGSIHYVPKS